MFNSVLSVDLAASYQSSTSHSQQRTGCVCLMTPTCWAVAFVWIILRRTLFQEILNHPVPVTVSICQAKKRTYGWKQVQAAWDTKTSSLQCGSSTREELRANMSFQTSVKTPFSYSLTVFAFHGLSWRTPGAPDLELTGAQGIHDLHRNAGSHEWSSSSWPAVLRSNHEDRLPQPQALHQAESFYHTAAI